MIDENQLETNVGPPPLKEYQDMRVIVPRSLPSVFTLLTALVALPAQAGVTLPNGAADACTGPVDTETGEPSCHAVLDTASGKVNIQYEMRHGKAVLEGDITLPASVHASGGLSTEAVGVGNATRRFQLGSLWPRGIVYYRYDSTVGAALKATIARLCAELGVNP